MYAMCLLWFGVVIMVLSFAAAAPQGVLECHEWIESFGNAEVVGWSPLLEEDTQTRGRLRRPQLRGGSCHRAGVQVPPWRAPLPGTGQCSPRGSQSVQEIWRSDGNEEMLFFSCSIAWNYVTSHLIHTNIYLFL